VQAFSDFNYDVPQFHGKWPFARLMGVQEPASVLFSIANLLPHVIMLRKLRREVPETAPMRQVWIVYGMV